MTAPRPPTSAVNPADPYNLLVGLWTDIRDMRVVWELAVLGAAFGLAAWVSHLLRPHLTSTDDLLSFSLGGLRRVQMPLTALAAVLAGRYVLREWHSTIELLNLAVPLLTAAAIARVVVYALRRAFAPGGGLDASERLVTWLAWLGFAIYITGLSPEFLRFLDDVGFSIGKDRISLLLVLEALLTIGVSLLIALWLGRTIEARLMREMSLDINLRVVFSKLIRAVLVLAAILIALPAIGLDVTALSVFGGALGVGVGLGLQKVVSNYLSGFIILMDRSVSLGDVVTVDRHSGQITKMTARYVVVRGVDGTETLIPNETMIASPVVNHSYSDRRVRVAVPVKVNRRADLELMLRLMEEAGSAHPRVLHDPPPKAIIKEYAFTGASLELGAWIEDPEAGIAEVASDIYAEIWRRFKAAGL